MVALQNGDIVTVSLGSGGIAKNGEFEFWDTAKISLLSSISVQNHQTVSLIQQGSMVDHLIAIPT